MARYAQGQPVRVSTEVRDTTGALTTPGSILLRVKKPDGTYLADYTNPTADTPAGKYHQDIPSSDLATLGHYQYAWITTGTAAGVSPPAAFEVVDPFAPTHITFGDVKQRLNITAASDDELQAMIASAVAEQEQRVGAVAPRTVVETVYPSCGRLWLSTRPVLSITSATYNGSSVATVGSWTVGLPMAGDVAWTAGGFYGATPYVVTYVAGRNPVPQDLVEAALLRVQHHAATQRGGSGGGQIIGSASTDLAEPSGSDFLLMLRAQDLEKPYVLPSVA